MKRIFFVSSLFIIIFIIIGIYIIKKPTYSAVYRGRLIAFKYGCFNCHGFEGIGGIKNPNYKYEEVPSFKGQTYMMFIKNPSEIKEWILYGKPRNRKVDNKGLIKMPAYENIISQKELNDLIIYLKVIMDLIEINDSIAKRGYEIAENMGCFGCHGPYGLGGMPNPRSLKGYIPGWDDKEFNRLVLNDKEMREWIKEGKIKRLEFILKFQTIKMPSYKEVLNEQQIDTIIYYIKYLRSNYALKF